MLGSRRGGFSIPDIVSWYIERVGLRDTDCLFPRFRRGRGGLAVPIGWLPMSYSTALMQLKVFCKRWRMDHLILHSGRIGAVMAVADR